MISILNRILYIYILTLSGIV